MFYLCCVPGLVAARTGLRGSGRLRPRTAVVSTREVRFPAHQLLALRRHRPASQRYILRYVGRKNLRVTQNRCILDAASDKISVEVPGGFHRYCVGSDVKIFGRTIESCFKVGKIGIVEPN